MTARQDGVPIDMPLTGTFGFDMSHLLDPPAGKHGFLTAREDGHFHFQDGAQGRFWGLNLFGGTGCFWPRECAADVADRLASMATTWFASTPFPQGASCRSCRMPDQSRVPGGIR